jgi:hypothetical protein
VYLMMGLLAVAAGVGYRVSLLIHPFRRCRRCAGTGKHRSLVFSHAYRLCRVCGGNGRRRRLGSRPASTNVSS